VQRLAAVRAWSQDNVGSYAETWGKLMNIPTAVPLNWLTRAKIRIAPIDRRDRRRAIARSRMPL
jgi:sulfonate transport system substrate-binding protein